MCLQSCSWKGAEPAATGTLPVSLADTEDGVPQRGWGTGTAQVPLRLQVLLPREDANGLGMVQGGRRASGAWAT